MPSLLRLAALLVALWATLPGPRHEPVAAAASRSVPGQVERTPVDDGDPRARRPEQVGEAVGATSRQEEERESGPPTVDRTSDRATHAVHGTGPAALLDAHGPSAAQAFLRVNGAADGAGKRA